MTYRKKLIEVALPLESINIASAEEKSVPRHGHPQTLHLWWARRPLAACRAVIWSSLVDDPSEYISDEENANRERERLFSILEKLVKWENSNNLEILEQARMEIARSMAREAGLDVPIGKEAVNEFLLREVPAILDPFAGGGSIPLEAQRLGINAQASDLNPVAVLINKALIEISPRFSGHPPVHPPEDRNRQESLLKKEWLGSEGLAEDVLYYGKWISNEARKIVGQLYPKVIISDEILDRAEGLVKQGIKPGDEVNVIAWLWARSVICPNPACKCEVPLVRSFNVINKSNNKIWIEPIIDRTSKTLSFAIKTNPKNPIPGTINRTGAKCLNCETIIPFDYIREQGKNKNISQKLMAMFGEGSHGRLYLPPEAEQVIAALNASPSWVPTTDLPNEALGFRVQLYGFTQHSDLFTSRQLTTLSVFSDMIEKTFAQVRSDAIASGSFTKDQTDLDKGGSQATAYAQAISVYLACAMSRLVSYNNANCVWNIKGGSIAQIFTRQTISMTWDFIETNPFENMSGNWLGAVEWVSDVLKGMLSITKGKVIQQDAAELLPSNTDNPIIVTDPPYYDNIGYADLSDFFYVWLRKNLRNVFPDLFRTILTPKTPELIADQNRHGGKDKAQIFFEQGLKKAFNNFNIRQDPRFPVAIFYAFKQTENIEEEETDLGGNSNLFASTGWETMLEALIGSGFVINGTWPMRTERISRMRSQASNALASSIVLVCRQRNLEAQNITRREFLTELKREIPISLRRLQLGNIAPVDLAQAAIGPGMSIFSRYKAVFEADGTPMRVRAALALINQSLDEYLAEQEGEYDGDTRWALAWFEQYGHEQGPYGVAETLSKAKNTSVEGLSHAGFLEARAGKVRLLKRDELDDDWDPNKDKRLTAWETAQYLIRTLDKEGEKGSGALLGKLGSFGEMARDLAYRLYTICERKGWAQEALAYNMLVVAWPRIKEQSGKGPRQESLL